MPTGTRVVDPRSADQIAAHLLASEEVLLPVIDLALELGIVVVPKTATNWCRGRGGLPALPAMLVGGRYRSTRTAFRNWLASTQLHLRKGLPCPA